LDDPVRRHMRRLRLVVMAFLAALAAYAGLIIALPDPKAPALPQAATLFWGLAFLAAANLATLLPTYRAMMVAPRRVFAAGRQAERLLAAHLSAHIVALARAQAVAVLGLLLFFLAERREWFWAFWAVAACATALLWPSRGKVVALVAPPGEAASAPSV